MPGRQVEGAHVYGLFLMEMLLRIGADHAPTKVHNYLGVWVLRAVADFHGVEREDLLGTPFRPEFLKLLRQVGTPPRPADGSAQECWLEHHARWLESLVTEKTNMAPDESPTVGEILQRLAAQEKPTRGSDSPARKYAVLAQELFDAPWRQVLSDMRKEVAEDRPHFDLLCAGLPPAFMVLVHLVERLGTNTTLQEITFPEFYALVTDAQEARRHRRFGWPRSDGPQEEDVLEPRVWDPPDTVIGNIKLDPRDEEYDPVTGRRWRILRRPKTPKDRLLSNIRSLKSGERRNAQLQISRRFPKTIELLDTWLEEGPDAEKYPSLDYRFDDEAQFQFLLNNAGFVNEVRDLNAEVHERAVHAITSGARAKGGE